jgi:hypothetical protein
MVSAKQLQRSNRKRQACGKPISASDPRLHYAENVVTVAPRKSRHFFLHRELGVFYRTDVRTDNDRNSLCVGTGPDRLLDADVEYDPLDAPAHLTYQVKTSVV